MLKAPSTVIEAAAAKGGMTDELFFSLFFFLSCLN
jgi:hypothetical protein